jgi:hypothetical protein
VRKAVRIQSCARTHDMWRALRGCGDCAPAGQFRIFEQAVEDCPFGVQDAASVHVGVEADLRRVGARGLGFHQQRAWLANERQRLVKAKTAHFGSGPGWLHQHRGLESQLDIEHRRHEHVPVEAMVAQQRLLQGVQPT